MPLIIGERRRSQDMTWFGGSAPESRCGALRGRRRGPAANGSYCAGGGLGWEPPRSAGPAGSNREV